MPISPGGKLFHTWCLIFVAANLGIPLEYLAQIAWKAHISGFHRTMAIRKTVLGRLPPQGLSVKDTSLLVLEFWPEA